MSLRSSVILMLAVSGVAWAAIEVGQKSPEFTLFNQDEKPVSLNEFQGKWVVLYFYPKDDTPGCTIEACDFRDNFVQFQSMNAVVLGVSADSPRRHRNFIKNHNLNITLLSDPERKVMEAYGAWTGKSVVRSTVLIDPEGKIAHHWPKVSVSGHAEEVRKHIADLQAAKK